MDDKERLEWDHIEETFLERFVKEGHSFVDGAELQHVRDVYIKKGEFIALRVTCNMYGYENYIVALALLFGIKNFAIVGSCNCSGGRDRFDLLDKKYGLHVVEAGVRYETRHERDDELFRLLKNVSTWDDVETFLRVSGYKTKTTTRS